MKKNRRTAVYCLFATLLIVSILSGCANKPHTGSIIEPHTGSIIEGRESAGDWPAMIMVDGTLYYKAYTVVESIDNDAIIGYTSSYTDNEPSKDGETNFSRTLGLPYARTEDGIAVKYNGQWNLFVQQNDNQSYKNGNSSMKRNQYVWEKKGFGGDFIITLNDDRTYQYYAGFLSSYIGMGTWINDNGIIVMTESSGYDNVFRFKLTEEGLIYIAEGSSKFMYVDVTDGDRFLLRSGIIWDEPSCSGVAVKGGVLLKEGTVKKISVTSQPEGYDYSFSGDDVQSVVNYLSELNLTSEYSENPDEYSGMTWVISLEYESGDTLMIYHFGNMFIKTAGSPWYKMTYEEASRFGKLIGELSK